MPEQDIPPKSSSSSVAPTPAEIFEASLSVLDAVSDIVTTTASSLPESRDIAHLKAWCNELSDFARQNPPNDHHSQVALFGFLELMADDLSGIAYQTKWNLIEDHKEQQLKNKDD